MNSEIYDRILDACRAYKAAGGAIVCGVWGDSKCACALGALVNIETENLALCRPIAVTAADLLNAGAAQIGSFANGFDGYGQDMCGNPCPDDDWNNAGFRLRNQLIMEGIMHEPVAGS